MKTLFYDLHSSGHHREYVQHLLDSLPTHLDISFALSQQLASDFSRNGKVEIITIPIAEDNQNRGKEISWLNELALKEKIEAIFFLNIDPYQTYIEDLSVNVKKVGGILFHSHHRIPWLYGNSPIDALKNLAKIFRAKHRLRLLSRSKRNNVLFLLDDKEGVKKLNETHRGIFRYLPDPISIVENKIVKNKINKKNEVLLFGSIIPRKNIEHLIRVLKKGDFSKWEFRIIGKGKQEYVESLRKLCLGMNVTIENRFVDYNEMDLIFHQTTIIMMVYKNFFGSSGVLGRAAYFNKPVIASKIGLIGELVKQYKLGATVKENFMGLSEALELSLDANLNSKSKEYLEDKKPYTFAQEIYNYLDSDR